MSRLDSLIAMFQKPFFRFNVPNEPAGFYADLLTSVAGEIFTVKGSVLAVMGVEV